MFFIFKVCNCNEDGSIGDELNGFACDDYGICSCKKANIINDKCDACASGFTNFPACESDGIYFGKFSYSYLNYLQKVGF